MAKKITYSFKDVLANLVGPGGSINLGDGAAVAQEGITVISNAPTNEMTIGADGGGMHSLNADKSGTFTVRLLKVSETNAQLMAMYNLQRAAASAWGQNTLTVFDRNRGDTVTGQQVAFQKVPDMSFAMQGGFVEWTFDSVVIDRIMGVGL